MPFAAPAPVRPAGTPTLQALDAQVALLPQALGVFAICLPIYVWVGSYAVDAKFMAASFAVFALNWAMFYAVVNWLKRDQARDEARRLRVQLLGGLLWAGAVAQMTAFADHAGPAREPLLMTAAAAAVICVFFTAPSLPSLLIVGPLAMAGPLVAFLARPETHAYSGAIWGAFSLAFMLSLVLNRNLRRQYEMAAEREQLVADREASLGRAEKLARSKSDLIATLSHEIRNGLTGVAHVLAAAAGQNGRAAPSREQLGAALAAANDLISVLNATLDSETAEAGSLKVEAAPFDPVRLVRDLAVLTRPQALARGLEFHVYVDPELEGRTVGATIGDAGRVRQVLANLIGNAVKYTLRGQIEARIEREGPNTIVVSVADTGPGLSPDELAVAFEPFKRIPRTGAGVPGAGLGLSLSRQLVALMDAELSADSAIGVGSCFTLRLGYDPQAVVAEEASDPAAGRPERSGMRILIAEDDGLNAAMLRTILEQLGHQVVHAQNGRRALDLAAVVDFDLLMLDGRMPEMDGRETCAAIRALPAPMNRLPIVAVIGGDADEARECLDAGANCVMRKPVSVGAVARALTEATTVARAKVSAAA